MGREWFQYIVTHPSIGIENCHSQILFLGISLKLAGHNIFMVPCLCVSLLRVKSISRLLGGKFISALPLRIYFF